MINRAYRAPGPCVFEWAMTLAALGVGLVILVNPEGEKSVYFPVLSHFVTVETIGLYYFLVGVGRLVAINISVPERIVAHLRALFSLLSCVAWGQTLAAHCADMVYYKSLPEVPVYAGLIFGEMFATLRAARDARYFGS